MKKKQFLLITTFLISLIFIYLSSNKVSQSDITDHKPQAEILNHEKLSATNLENIVDSHQKRATRNKQLISKDARKFYIHANEYGWDKIVNEFENGNIQKSEMTLEERNKICDMTIVMTQKNSIDRLLNAGCYPTGKNISNLVINPMIIDNNKNINQDVIISKLEKLKERGILQTQISYDKNLKEDKNGNMIISLFDRAVYYGMDEVLSYVASVGSEPSQDNDLFLKQLMGNTSIPTIQKLIELGYTPTNEARQYMKQKNYETQHPEIFELLNK